MFVTVTGDAEQIELIALNTLGNLESLLQLTPTALNALIGLALFSGDVSINFILDHTAGEAYLAFRSYPGPYVNSWAAGPNTIGFLGAAPVGQQVSGGTLAGVIAGLVALGLFSS